MSDHPDTCALAAVDRRLNDAHQLWHQANEHYFDPDQFRIAAQGTIQTLRSVTFILQKHGAAIPKFDTWYGTREKKGYWQERLAKTPVMRWLVDARNRIEKEGDLESKSFVRAEIIASHLDEGPRMEVPASLFEEPGKLLAGLPKDALKHITEHGMLRIERRWIADSYPDVELLEALATAYGHLSELIDDAHKQLGLQSPVTTDLDTGETYDAAAIGWRLPCMIGHANPRALLLSLSDGGLISVERQARKVDPESGKVLTERYGVDPQTLQPGEAASVEERARKLFELARIMFVRDGHHVPIVFLLRGTQQVRVMQIDAENRRAKYVRSRLIADEVARTGADGVIMIGETWLAPQSALAPYESPADFEAREEALFLELATKIGGQMSLMAKIERDDQRVSLEETTESRDGTFYSFGPVFAVWGRPI